jgi:hypothetical protein
VIGYYLWRLLSPGIEAHMREHLTIRDLMAMVDAPPELLDRRGLYVQELAVKLLDEETSR